MKLDHDIPTSSTYPIFLYETAAETTGPSQAREESAP